MDPTKYFCDINIDMTPEIAREIIQRNVKKLVLEGRTPLLKNPDIVFSSNEEKESPRDARNPFLDIEIRPFRNLSAYSLASIDAYFNISGHNSGPVAPQIFKLQSYVLSGQKDIGFAEYIQYRNIISFIYVLGPISLQEIDNSIINYSRLKEVNNYDNFRYANLDFYVDEILKVNLKGVDTFIIENSSSNVELVHELIIMLRTLKDRGDTIISVDSIHEEFILDLLQILSNCFDSVSLFKPCTSDKEIYIVCNFFSKGNSTESTRFLRDIIKKGSYNDNINKLLRKRNTQIDDYFDDIMNQIEDSTHTLYTVDKIKIYLNIQSN